MVVVVRVAHHAIVSPSLGDLGAPNANLMESMVLFRGSADQIELELAMLESVVLAEAEDHMSWTFLARVIEHIEGSAAFGKQPERLV